MKALIYLYFLRMKGNIRNVFSKPSSAIIASLMILFYGGMFIAMLTFGDTTLSMYHITDANFAIFVGIGMTAMMVGIMLMQSRKALFMENDAFYLFAGPFKRSQTMQFIMSQSIIGSLLCGLISLFMMVVFGNSLQYDILFLLLVVLSHSLVYFFFTALYYYLYLLSIKDKKYKHISQYTLIVFILIIIGCFVAVLAQNNFVLDNAGVRFINSELFYGVPLFGWIKMILISYVANDVVLLMLGLVLLLIACGIIYVMMIRYKGDFVEVAMQDAIEFTTRYKEVKAGTRKSMNDKKIRNIKHAEFKEGAGAIFSKNILLMKKANTFFGYQDIIYIVIYLVISILSDLGFMFFVYMMIFWVFLSVQNAEFMKEMENYQIYLIPASPLKKLWYLLLPYFIKYIVLAALPILLGAVLMHANFLEALQYYIMLAGYACLFISGSVLATRILKSRNNAILENMLRMIVIVMAALPSIIVIMIISNIGLLNIQSIILMSVLSLLMNFIVSGLIIYSCKGMMNGREIKSE